jgi:hypothetical protein
LCRATLRLRCDPSQISFTLVVILRLNEGSLLRLLLSLRLPLFLLLFLPLQNSLP